MLSNAICVPPEPRRFRRCSMRARPPSWEK
jgi:hypothetical protein